MDEGRDPAPPANVTLSRFPDGFEITLLPPPRLKYPLKQLLGNLLGAFVFMIFGGAIVGFLLAIGKADDGCIVGGAICFGGGMLALSILMIVGHFDWTRETAVLEARGGLLTLVRSGGRTPKQLSMADIASVRTSPLDDESFKYGLQFILKNRDTFTTLEGRRRIELDWVAGLLRAALALPRRAAPVAAAPLVYTAGGECQICGWAMERRVVLCVKCRTPHHEECWTWNGACSTYGCREIRFTRTA
jgi:hypothetical protein